MGTPLLRLPEHLMVRHGPVLIWVARGQLDDEVRHRARDLALALADEHPAGVALLLVAFGEGELFKLQARRRIASGLAGLGERLQCMAVAFEGGSRWLSSARAAVEGVVEAIKDLTGSGSVPLRVFGERDEAIVWLNGAARRSDGRPLDDEQLGDAVEAAIAALPG